MRSGKEGQSREENMWTAINPKDLLKSHMETFYHNMCVHTHTHMEFKWRHYELEDKMPPLYILCPKVKLPVPGITFW